MELKTVYVDPTTGAETVLTGFDYTLNQSGHRLAVTEADGRQVNYTYDELYRLTEENINNGERVLAYTYDSVGNRLTKDDSLVGLTTYTYDANDRLLSEVLTQAGVTIHTITYTYDDNGNLLSRTQVTDAASETTTYTWNDDDRLVAVATPDGSSVTYEYDEEGIRVSSTVDGVTTDYLVDKNRPYAQVLEELNSEQLQAFYVYGHDLISQTRNTQQDFYQVDGLGSTRVLTDENGNVTDTYDYEAFGELIESSGESENSYRFAGEQFDESLGDYYLRDRFYDPSSGRFIRRDTWQGDLTNPISLHKYLYGHGNPANLVDPSGLAALSLGELTTLFAVAALLATYTNSAIQLGPPPESLGGFGEGSQSREAISQGAYGPLINAPDFVRDLIQRTSILLSSAAVDLPDLTGKPSAEAEQELQDAGFQDMGSTSGGYRKWYHPDGSRVQIAPNGQVKRTAPKTISPKTGKKYRPRIDQNGQEIPHNPGGSEHETGEIIKP